MEAARRLDVEILKDGWWSGNVSSKAGTNIHRKDLQDMIAYCKKNKRVKYLIVDEPDRFMRSIDEATYFEVTFKMLGVTVWYASDQNLNTGDLMSKMLKFSKYFTAEGSNVERQSKSVNGHRKAVSEGRYTFPPKPGYTKGSQPGVHVPHSLEYHPLQKALKEIASGLYKPSEALRRLNDSQFTHSRESMKIDKFLQFACDPYYAGIIEIKKQVNMRNENGQHQAMISKDEHQLILQAIRGRATRPYTRKQYNPEFPLAKLMKHDCEQGAKFTGSFQNNGHGKSYPKYRCRSCGKQYHRAMVNDSLNSMLEQFDYTGSQRGDFIEALSLVWHQKQQDTIGNIKRLNQKLEALETSKSQLLREIARADSTLKQDFEGELLKIKAQITVVEEDLDESSSLQNDLVEFVEFGLEYTNILKEDWWLLDKNQREECQQLFFREEIRLNSAGKVGTTQISPLYRLAANKKDLRIDRKSLLVELRGIAPRSVELKGWFLQV